MTRDASRLLEEALQLTPSERAKIAAELLSSLDDQDDDVKAAWAVEIARRASDAEADPDDEEDWRTALDDVRREVLSRYANGDRVKVPIRSIRPNHFANGLISIFDRGSTSYVSLY